MINTLIRFKAQFVLFGSLLITSWSHAELLLPQFPLSEVVEQSRQSIPEHRFVTGKVSSIGSLVRTESEKILAGDVIRVTYEIPRVHTTQEVAAHYQAVLQRLGASTLFYCEGRDCGRSNDWANEIFQERILFGPDRFQYYIATTFEHDNNYYAAVIYATRRGNQRVYAHVEQIRMDQPLDQEGRDKNLFLILEEDLESLRELQDRLERWVEQQELGDEKPAVHLVAYSRKAGKSASENLEHAADLGHTMKVYLARQMFDEDRISLINVGPFAGSSRFARKDSYLELFLTPAE